MRSLGIQKFGEVAPDQPDFSTDHMEIANNCIARLNGFEPFPSAEVFTQALTQRAVGAASYLDSARNAYTLVGTTDGIFQADNGAWLDVSRPIAYTTTDRWEFAKWGNDVYAAGGSGNRIQSMTLGSPQFNDVPGELIQPEHICVVRNQLMVGNITDADGYTPNRVRWSAVNTPEDWVPSQATLSGFTQLESTQSGSIVRLIGGEFVIAFLERNIWRGTFTGSANQAFQWDEVEKGARVFNSGGIVEHDGVVLYLSEDGFRMTQGGQSQAIGEERIDNTILSDLDANYLDRITSSVLTDDQVIVWAYPGQGNNGGICNKLVIYNYGANKWSTGDESVQQLTQIRAPRRTLDDLDTIFASIDTVAGSLDDKVYTGGGLEAGMIAGDGKGYFFIGPPRDATFETSERQPAPGRRVQVTEIRPVIEAADIELQIGYRATQGQVVQTTTPVTLNASGVFETRINSRYLRYRVTVKSPWQSAFGLEPFGEMSGGR